MPENLLSRMVEATTSTAVAFNEFILKHKKKPDAIFCFFEGQDDYIYYKPRLFNIIDKNNFYEFNCGGKSNVKSTYNLIKSNDTYRVVKAGFFIDRDFDESIRNSDFYETPCYSIENFYLDKRGIKEIFIDLFNIDRESSDLTISMDLFNDLLDKFHDLTIALNSWLSCYADLKSQGLINRKLNIDGTVGVLLDNVVKGDLKDVKTIMTIANLTAIEKLFSCQGTVEDNAFFKKVNWFKTTEKIDVFRGKFQLKFLCSFLKKFKIIAGNKVATMLSKDYHSKFEFEYANLTTLLNTYARTPECLLHYVNKIN